MLIPHSSSTPHDSTESSVHCLPEAPVYTQRQHAAALRRTAADWLVAEEARPRRLAERKQQYIRSLRHEEARWNAQIDACEQMLAAARRNLAELTDTARVLLNEAPHLIRQRLNAESSVERLRAKHEASRHKLLRCELDLQRLSHRMDHLQDSVRNSEQVRRAVLQRIEAQIIQPLRVALSDWIEGQKQVAAALAQLSRRLRNSLRDDSLALSGGQQTADLAGRINERVTTFQTEWMNLFHQFEVMENLTETQLRSRLDAAFEKFIHAERWNLITRDSPSARLSLMVWAMTSAYSTLLALIPVAWIYVWSRHRQNMDAAHGNLAALNLMSVSNGQGKTPYMVAEVNDAQLRRYLGQYAERFANTWNTLGRFQEWVTGPDSPDTALRFPDGENDLSTEERLERAYTMPFLSVSCKYDAYGKDVLLRAFIAAMRANALPVTLLQTAYRMFSLGPPVQCVALFDQFTGVVRPGSDSMDVTALGFLDEISRADRQSPPVALHACALPGGFYALMATAVVCVALIQTASVYFLAIRPLRQRLAALNAGQPLLRSRSINDAMNKLVNSVQHAFCKRNRLEEALGSLDEADRHVVRGQIKRCLESDTRADSGFATLSSEVIRTLEASVHHSPTVRELNHQRQLADQRMGDLMTERVRLNHLQALYEAESQQAYASVQRAEEKQRKALGQQEQQMIDLSAALRQKRNEEDMLTMRLNLLREFRQEAIDSLCEDEQTDVRKETLQRESEQAEQLRVLGAQLGSFVSDAAWRLVQQRHLGVSDDELVSRVVAGRFSNPFGEDVNVGAHKAGSYLSTQHAVYALMDGVVQILSQLAGSPAGLSGRGDASGKAVQITHDRPVGRLARLCKDGRAVVDTVYQSSLAYIHGEDGICITHAHPV